MKAGGGNGGRHDESSSEDEIESPHRAAAPYGPGRGINEILRKALEEASNPGDGDEEPEILPAPGGFETHGRREPEEDEEEAAKRREYEQKGKAMFEEERRVAEMSFDPDALLPCDSMVERAKYIPLRLTYEERKALRLVNASVNVSDYTTAVDIPFKNKARRRQMQLQFIVAFLSGIIVATDYDKGRTVLSDRNFEPFEGQIQKVLEIARRYKITNPEKMRSEYGKLVYLIQDASSAEIKQLVGVDIGRPIRTVYELLESCDGLGVLSDPAIATATAEILPDKSKSRAQIQLEIKRKEKAANDIVRRYTTRRLPEDTIRHCLYSISDNNSFLNSNKKPITDCIELLKHYFSPSRVSTGEYFQYF